MGGQRKGTGATVSQGATGGRRITRRSTPGAGQPLPVLQEGYSPVWTVFDQPELVEMILDYAIHGENVEKRLKTLRAVRLVDKSWLTEMTNLMRRNKEPQFKLQLTKDNSLNGAPEVEAKGKLLDLFATTVRNRVEKPFPTFSLKISKEFFRLENFDSLVSFLRLCTEGLVELEMVIPEKGGSLPGMLPIADLPILQKLVVTFPDEELAVNLSDNELDFGHPTSVTFLINSFLNRAQSLNEFTIPPFGPDSSVDPAPIGFEILALPKSTTSVELNCQMTSEQLQVLVRNKLPSLRKLELTLDNTSFADGLLTNILNKFCQHLETLHIRGMYYKGPPRMTNFVRFPVMKKLTSLQISSSSFELEADHPPLNHCFPKLDTLSIYDQTPQMLRKWTTGTPLNSVSDFGLSLIDENQAESSSAYQLPLDLESIRSVHVAFPNVRDLGLELSSGTQACGLKYLFMEMRQLIHLTIKVVGTEFIINSNYWDSVFTGAPVAIIAALRDNPDFLTHFELKDSVPSIKMLKELQTLNLEAVVDSTDARVTQPLISDLTFTLSLLKMPNLQSLFFYGRFAATSAMTEAWKKEGRKLEYSSLPTDPIIIDQLIRI